MTSIRTLAVHDVVQYTFPRPPTERQELGMAIGKAIDTTLSRYSHEFERGLRPTAGAMTAAARSTFQEELRDIDLSVSAEELSKADGQMAAVLRAFRKTEVFGLPRPKTRLIVINDRVGVYAQPDYWDRRNRFYEMKSYRAVPPPADVVLQLRLFQLAFQGFDGFLVCVNRHANPPDVLIAPVVPISPHDSEDTLRLALRLGLEHGQEKVLEYIDSPSVRYSVPEGEPARTE